MADVLGIRDDTLLRGKDSVRPARAARLRRIVAEQLAALGLRIRK